MQLFLPILATIFFLACQNSTSTEASENPETDTADTLTAAPPKPSDTLEAYTFSTDYLMGKFDPARHPDFEQIGPPYADQNYHLHFLTAEAFRKMHAAAKEDGISLTIISATRPFDRQKYLWERKWDGRRLVDGQDLSQAIPNPKERALKILEYSSMPGTSRHHWGTDIDINNLENDYFTTGKGLKEYEWLVANASRFGFCQVYSEKGEERPYGYNLEKWHWSYLPLARKLTALAEAELKDKMISGFQGAETAPQIDVVEKYVLGINPACR